MSDNSDEKQEALVIKTGSISWLPIQVDDVTYYLRLWDAPVADVSIQSGNARNWTAEDERILTAGITSTGLMAYDESNQRLGIRTTNPQYEKDVNGDCRLSGGEVAGSGSIVSSSAATRGQIHFGTSAYDESEWANDPGPEAEYEIHSTDHGYRSWVATPVGKVYEDEMELLATGVEQRLAYGTALTKEELEAMKLGDRPRALYCETCRLTPPRGYLNAAASLFYCSTCFGKMKPTTVKGS